MKPLFGNKRYIVSIFLTIVIVFCTHIAGYADITPVSERTSQVRDAIVAAVPGVNSAADVTEAHLANIHTLSLSRKNITALKEGDFDGLSSLRSLWLGGNQLSSLSAGIFSGLTSLTTITLPQNQLSSLPEGVFSGLSALTTLSLYRNQLSSLPAGIFTGLTSLTEIDLGRNQLSSLPAGIFTGLTSLKVINLWQNRLSSLPAGMFTGLTSLTKIDLPGGRLSNLPVNLFSGLTSLTQLRLSCNRFNNLPGRIFSGLSSLTHLTLSGKSTGSLPNGILSGLTSLTNLSLYNANIDASLTVLPQDIGRNQFKVVVPTGAPFTIVAPLNVTNGSIMGGATTATIPIGSVESTPFTLIPTPGASDDPTVLIGTLPDPPSEHSGYTLTHFNLAPAFVEGQNTTRTVAEDIHTGGYIGTAVTAIDPHNDVLTYSLGGADASSFAIDPTTGQLKTNIKFDYETRTTYTVTVNATDATLTASITVTITVSDVEPETRNVGIPRTVRLFYLLPNDKPYRAEVVAAMKTGVVDIQSFFREQMETHGHGSKTFQIETDDQGDPIVHRVDGDYPESEYQGRTKGEIKRDYDNSQNVILIVLDRGTGGGGHGVGNGKKSSGFAMIYGGWNWFAAAHELGHAFGLHHDFRDRADIMGYDRPTRSAAELSAGAAEFLAVNPYFNPNIPLKYESPPTLELLSSKFYPHDAKSVPIRLRVRDADGLYQVMLLVSTKKVLGASGMEVKEFRKLAGETDTIIEFNYDGTTPSDSTTSLADPLRHPIGFLFTDMLGNNEGNVAYPRFVFEGKKINTNLPVSQRTPQVRDAIVAAVPGVNNANDVTKTHLATITNLNLNRKSITSLKLGDFHGLTGLTTLDLSGNSFSVLPFGIFNDNTRLTSLRLETSIDAGTLDNLTNLTELHLSTSTLPSGIFDNLTNLTELHLRFFVPTSLPDGIFDDLTALTKLNLWVRNSTFLPSGVFDNLTNLTELHLRFRDPTSLPDGIFDDLTALTKLNLSNNRLTSLPSGIFDNNTALTTINLGANDLTSLLSDIFKNNTALTTLYLNSNDLTSLPDGIFKGLTQLKLLYLSGNRHYTMPLTVSLEKVGKNQVKAVAPTGAPFKIVLPLTVTNGSISGGASSITIPIGSVESGTLTLTRTPGTTTAVTVDIGTLPGTPLNSGYTLVKSDDLPLEFTSIDVVANNAPVFTDGTSITRSISENTASGQNIGTAISATDADSSDTLTYTLSGTDAASFSIVSTSGQLQTKAALDYETKTAYSVTISVSDGNGGSANIAVTINVTDVRELLSDRTPAVRDAIVRAARVNSAADVTEAHLAAITALDLSRLDIPALKSGDFDGLTALTNLNLSDNDLTSLPADVFDGLSSLTTLTLGTNRLTALPPDIFDGLTALTNLDLSNLNNLVFGEFTTLPVDVFDGLTALTTLNLQGNDFSALPAGIFDGLTALTDLRLNANKLTTLPAGVFDGLTHLEKLNLSGNDLMTLPGKIFDDLTSAKTIWLDNNKLNSLPVDIFDGLTSVVLFLDNNKLTSLPDGIFEGLTSLLSIGLQGNPGAPFRLNVSLEKVGTDQFKAVIPTGAPFNIVLPITVVNGGIKNLKTTITIPTGSVESQPLTVTRTPGTTAAVTVNIGTLPGLPSSPYRHSGYTLVKPSNSVLAFTDIDVSVVTPVSNRTPAVRDAIVAAVPGVNNATDVTEAHLTTIRSLNLENKSITSLKSGDFDGLTSLRYLTLTYNDLTSLPAGVFSNLSSLWRLLLYGNDLTSLPSGVFDDLSSLTELNLYNNDLTSLPTGVFDNLTSLTRLGLGLNQLTSLPAGIFDNLTSLKFLGLGSGKYANRNQITSLPAGVFSNLVVLTDLVLYNNSLSSLPDGVFSNLSSLTRLWLQGNAVDPMLLTVSLEKVADGQFKAVAPTGAPFAMELPLTVTNGSITGGATSLTIAAGSVESGTLTVTRTPGTTAAVTVDIGTLPGLPNNTDDVLGYRLHQGYILVKSTDLPLEVIAGTNNRPVFTDGTSTTRAIAENTAANVNIGAAISATDADTADTLTYTLSGTDAAAFSIVSTTGQLQTNAALDYETKNAYSVTISVADGNGGSASIAVTINVTDVNENRAPVFTDGATATRSIAENTASGQNIGTAIAATDADTGDTLTYTLGGTDASSFSIVSTSGQLQTNATLDYETKASYTVTVSVSDGSLTATITVTITVTDIDETPVDTVEVIPAAPGICKVGDTLAPGESCTYPGTDDAFSVNDNGVGQFLFFTAGDNLNIQNTELNGLSYTLVAKKLASGSWEIEEIGNRRTALQTANTAPTFTDGTSTTRTIAENTSSGQNIGTAIAATDADSGDTLTYTLGGTDAAVFDIVSTTGQLQTKAALDYEIKNTYSVTISVSDGNGGSASIAVTITITDVNENRAPVFSDGTSTTRTVALPAGKPVGDYDIGDPIIVTDPDGDNMTYTLEGTNADLFHTYASRTANGAYSLQLTTRGKSLHDGTGATYSVIYTVSDASGASSSIAVTITVTDVGGTTNTAPVFTDGTSTARSIAENIASGEHIGTAIVATDADSDTLTYTLGGTDAASFGIDATTGQLKTKAALDYETKATYTVTVSVSDGSSTTTITVTINITDINELPTTTAICKVGDILKPGQSCAYPGTDAVFSVLGDGTAQWHIPNLPAWLAWLNQTSISGSLRVSTTVNGQAYHFVAEQVGTSWEIKEIGDDRSDPQPETPEQPEETPPGGGTPTLTVSTASPLTEATLHGGVVTLTLNGGTYEASWRIRNAVSVSGISGVTVETFDVDRVNDTQITVELTYAGNMNASSTLTFTLGADAIKDYDGGALISQISVPSVTESVTASTASPLTEATLDESIITLTLSGRKFERWNSTIRPAVSVSGIAGVTVRSFDIDRESDTEVSVELTYDGNMNADGTLTITVGADAIAGYNGPAFTTQISVSDTTEPRILTEKPVESDYDHIEGPWLWMIAPGGDIDADNLSGASDGVITEARIAQSGVNEGDHFNDLQWTSGRLLPTTVCGIFVCSSENVINVVKEIGLTDKDQLNSYSAYALINIASPRDQNDVLMGVGSDDSIKVWLNGSVVYKNDVSRRTKGIQNRFPVHLNAGDNLLLIKVCNHSALFGNNDWGMFFKLYLDTQDYTLSLPMVLPGTQQPVAPEVTETPQQPQQPGNTGGTPTLTVSTASPLTEATLDESIITLTLSGRKFERRNSAIRRAVSVSGISGVTVRNSDIDRQSDTEVSVELTYDGDMRTDGTLTITVGADAIAGYDGPALTVQLSVSAADEPVAGGQTPDPTQQPGNTGGTPTLTVSTASPLTEATLHGGVVTLTLSSGTYERSSWRMREAITVSGISGLAFDKFSVDRVSDTQVTLELEFDGNMNANGTLTISVGAGTIKDYDGAALTGQIAVSAVTESITVSTASPLTEATLDESVITLTLSGRKFERWNSTIRLAVSVSGIAGVTVRSFDIDRESDTEVTVELTFNGNMNADGTLTITVGADAIAGYDGPAFTARLHVTANTESVAASTTAPLKEATLDGSVVTLTLSGAKYAKSIWDLREAVSVSGINGVTIPWHQPRRKSDTEITIKLEFDGNMNTDGTLTFTVGADAIAGYNGALTAQITVTADRENILLANFPNPFNPETWIPYQLAKDADVTLHIYSVNGTLIQTLTLGYQPAGFYYSRSRAAYWDGKNALGEPVASGVYFYTITAGDFTATRKMLIRK